MGSKPFLTGEDLKIAFNLFCCVYGIGTLGMPANFSRAGPVLATIALLFMAFANVYSSVVITKVMLTAPRSVQTYSDLGEFCMGKTGRWLVVVFQMANCLLIPCAFLVLGGTLLTSLFPDTFKDSTWIILMAIMVLPVCLIPTLKEGAGAAFAGCMGTLIADVIGVSMLLHGMSGHPSVPSPHLTFKQVATTFGNLSLAYGAGIVIPALQRQHSEPTRMPRVVFVTITFISCLFLALASSGYSAVGCQISGNLLFSIFPNATTGLSKLGFHSDKGMAVLAYLFMQLHITIAFAVIVSPSFYLLERMVLGMHKRKPEDEIEAIDYESANTPVIHDKSRASKGSVVSMADIERVEENDGGEAEAREYRGANAIKYVILRVVVVAILVVASVALKDHFLDLQDFIGASAVTMSCIILPIVFYLKKLWNKIPMYEKIPAIIVVVVCFVLGCYVTYNSGKQLFNPDSTDPEILFPFCDADERRQIYYNATA
uniref:Amino acid transporter transmembrane domain-containing protein n=2 Tax=Globisporangium ultimum (strain ATCC 200006 / CBS 805.95 / DAOM BR144) TaxID=431595 RepID=K3WQZ7_GLOUD